MSKKERLVLVDGSAVFHRGYHAIPHLSNASGEPTNATYGYTLALLKTLSDLKPKYAIVAWDKSGDTFRKDMYPQYKAHRKKQPDDLYAQIPDTKAVTEALGLPWIELEKFEADDIIGTLARQAEERGFETIIVSGDRDELQLIDSNTTVQLFNPAKRSTTTYDLAAMQDQYGLTPQQFIDYKALLGDASDNIPGVPGIGDVGARKLLAEYKTLDGIYENLDKISGKVHDYLAENKQLAYLSLELSTIVLDAPVELDLKPATVGHYDRQQIHELFRRLEFRTLLDKLPPELTSAPTLFDDAVTVEKERKHLKSARYTAVTTPSQLADLAKILYSSKAFAFDTETTSVDDNSAELVGISACLKEGEAYYIPVAHKQGPQLGMKTVIEALRPAFEDPKIGKVAHNAKYDYKVLARHGLTPSPISFDTMIAAFMLNPLGRSQSLDNLAYNEFGIEMIPISDLIGSGRSQTTFDHVDIETATTYAAEDADITWRLYQRMAPQIKTAGLTKLAETTEWPLIEVLSQMELTGIKLDVDFLHNLSKKFAIDIKKCEQKIWEAAGEQFNVSSPAQLANILYEKLGLDKSGVKKGKTGYSTAATELDKLRDAHPIIPLISEFRELSKLQNTYVITLPEQVDKYDRVHTSFNQTIAQTGRLNSTNPNLQNIPVRTGVGRQIRTAFIAPKGRVLISADYSQIELRVAAALSEDQGMIDTFKQGIDLHLQTASELFNVPLDKVTKEQRYSSKTINFGVLYGQTAHGLSVSTGMTREEAAVFIERYFELRKTLKDYIEGLKEFGRKHGYTETLLGRRRPCPEITSSNFMIRSAAERIAVNVPIQGTAADIMKMAMVALMPQLPKGADLLLQIHDELIVECDQTQSEEVEAIMKEVMESVYDLGVPIVVDTDSGHNWGEL